MATIIVGALDTLDTAYFAADNIYEFEHNHNLLGVTINLPAYVTLRFNGGSLDNGTLIGDGTLIQAGMNVIFGKTLLIDPSGTWKVDKAYSDWFDCYKDGYDIDSTTFNYTAHTYAFGSTTGIAMGTACGATGTSDRNILQQLLNLSANHTIISEGNYMVDSGEGSGDVMSRHLHWHQKKGLTLQIDGVLKLIPNAFGSYTMLLVADCEDIKICGSGKLVGDLIEHTDTGGEWGICLQVYNTIGLTLENLVFEQGWGDGVYYSYSKTGVDRKTNTQINHTWNNVKCLHNRRTGFALENGDYVYINNSEFSYTSMFNGTATYAGVDIEPFRNTQPYQHYCKEIHFDGCTAKYNGRGSAFRFERLIGGSVTNCDISDNQNGICLLECSWSYTNFPGEPVDIVKNRIVIENNTFRNNYGDTIWSDGGIFPYAAPENKIRASSAIVTNNFVQNAGSFISGQWQDTLVQNNMVYNIRNVFSLSAVISNFKFLNNYVYGIDAYDEGTASNYSSAMFDIRFWGDPAQICENVLIKDNIFKYAGNQIIHGSNGDNPLPYPTVKAYLFYHTFAETNSVKYIDNFFSDELWGPFHLDNHNYTYYGDLGMIQERTLRATDLQTVKHLMKGDKLEMYGQTGLVTLTGWTDVVGTEFLVGGADNMAKKNQIFHDPARTYMFRTADDGNAGNALPTVWDVNGIGIAYISLVPPVVEWQGVGVCQAGDRPTEFNTQGRTLVEVDPGVSTQMIQWDGSAWVVL